VETEAGPNPGLRPIPPTLMALVRDMKAFGDAYVAEHDLSDPKSREGFAREMAKRQKPIMERLTGTSAEPLLKEMLAQRDRIVAANQSGADEDARQALAQLESLSKRIEAMLAAAEAGDRTNIRHRLVGGTPEEAEKVVAQVGHAADSAAEAAQWEQRQNDMRQILMGAAMFVTENRGEWPATLSELSPYFGTDTALIARGDAEFSYRRPGPTATVREGDVERVVHPPVLCEKRSVGTDRLLVGFADGHTETVTDPGRLRELRAFFSQPVVVECVVHDLDDGVDQQALSLRTGRVLTVPPGFDHRGEQGRQWLTAQAVDLFVDQANSRWAILGLGLSFGDLPNEQWERTTVEDAETALKAGSRLLERVEHRDGLIHALPVGAKPPLTFAFRTWTGVLGVLQITGFSEESRDGSVRLRYRLLTPSANAPAASPSSDARSALLNERFASLRHALAEALGEPKLATANAPASPN